MKHTKEYYESFIGKTFKGIKFKDTDTCGYALSMGKHIGEEGIVESFGEHNETLRVRFKHDSWNYPADLVIEQILKEENPKSTQLLHDKFGNKESQTFNPEKHYFNEPKTFRSLFELSHILELNEWEFDILKRLVRCRKKGQFAEDLQKIKNTVDIYKEEYNESK